MMASAGNPNQQQQQQPFDMHKLFKPSSSTPPPSPPPSSSNTSPLLSPPPSSSSLPPPPSSSSSASYPPPTTTTYSYPPQSPPSYHLYSPLLLGEHPHPNHHHHQAPPPPSPSSTSYPTSQLSPPSPNPGGARLMALLGSKPQPSNLETLQTPPPFPSPPPSIASSTTTMGVSAPEFSIPSNTSIFPSSVPSTPPINFAAPLPTPMRFPSSKLPRGRHLIGDRVLYDIDVRMKGESQPQLEVTPITKYISDPGLVIGRQIAVNRSYICYGLKMGNIRVLNINTALRSLLRGHAQVGSCQS